jgi:hypothetical protein
MEANGEPKVTWYGEVHLFMHFLAINLALVRCYCVLDEDELGSILKCTQLSWSVSRNYTQVQVKKAKRP